MMKTSNTTDLRRSFIMPSKGQLYKKEMAEMKPMKKKPAKKAAAKKKGK
jgi:hypothetical protein